MNILYIDPRVHTAVGEKYSYYDGLYDEFSKISNCFLYQNTRFDSIEEPIKAAPFEPDAIYFGIGWSKLSQEHFQKNLNTNNISCPTILNLYKPQLFLETKLQFCVKNNVSLIVSSLPDYKEHQAKTGILCERLPFGVDHNVFRDWGQEKAYDIGFSGALHNVDSSPFYKNAFVAPNIRLKIQELLIREEKIKSFLNGSDSVAPRLSYKDYATKINQSKMWLVTGAPCGEITPRYFEIGMSKALTLCNEIPESYRDIFVDGVNCVEFSNDLSDFLDKVYYYLEHDDIAQEIINNAYDEFHGKHTWAKRAETLLGYIEKLNA